MTEDGYSGVLRLDHKSVTVEAAEYATRDSAVSATRLYPDLTDADLSLIPKTVEENGRTLTLDDVLSLRTVNDLAMCVKGVIKKRYRITITQNVSRRQIITANKSIFADFFHATWNYNTGESSATGESVHSNCFYIIRNGNAFKFTIVRQLEKTIKA